MGLGQQLYQHIFPPSFELMPKDRRLLEQMYPNIDWSYVQCKDRMPWFMHYTFAIGTALPYSYSSSRLNIYLRQQAQMSTNQRLCILVHEAFHIQQYHDLNSMGKHTSGWGFNRRFIRYYLGWYLQGLYKAFIRDKKTWKAANQYAYRQHPMEIPAYKHEDLFRQQINLYRGHSVNIFFQQMPQLICQHTNLPNAPIPVFYVLATILSILITLAKPIIEVIILPIVLLLKRF